MDPFEFVIIPPTRFGNAEFDFVGPVGDDDDQVDGIDLSGPLTHRTPVECHNGLGFGRNSVDRRENDTGLVRGLPELEVIALEINALARGFCGNAQELITFFKKAKIVL